MALPPQTQVAQHKGILKGMKQYIQMYNFVSYVEEQNQLIYADSEMVEDMRTKAVGYGLVDREECINHYAKTYKVSKPVAAKVCRAALSDKYKYLKNYQFGITWDTLEVRPGEGVDFIQKLGPFRIGMWADILNRYSPLSNVGSVIISLIALVVAILVAIFK